MSALSFDVVKKALLDAGFEVFRAKGDTVQLAERVRSHLMDANVAVRVTSAGVSIELVVRSQRSDFPNDAADQLFARVRAAVAAQAGQQGFAESAAATRTIQDPGDDTRTLDTWHELTFAKNTNDLGALVSDVQYALALPKCVSA